MIAGERVILRALENEDLDRCFLWMNDPQIVRTLESRYPMVTTSGDGICSNRTGSFRKERSPGSSIARGRITTS